MMLQKLEETPKKVSSSTENEMMEIFEATWIEAWAHKGNDLVFKR